MACAGMAPCGCGIHPYHGLDKVMGFKNAYVRCGQHSQQGRQQVYALNEAGRLAWEDNYTGKRGEGR